MPTIEILHVEIQNFLSIEFCTLDTQNLKPGLYLFDGPVGAGKSSLAVEALAWGLFGKTVRELPYADDVILRPNCGSDIIARIFIKFRVDRVRYAISRARSFGKTSLNFFKEDRTITTSYALETQAAIEAVLGMDWRLFCSSFVFGQSSHFKFSSLGNKERRLVLESALGVDIYRGASTKARKKTAELSANIKALEGFQEEARIEEKNLGVRCDELLTSLQGVTSKRQELLALCKEIRENKDFIYDDYLLRNQLSQQRKSLTSLSNEAEEKLELLEQSEVFSDREQHDLHKLLQRKNCPTCGQLTKGMLPEERSIANIKLERLKDNQIKRTEKIKIAREKAIEIAQKINDIDTKFEESDEKKHKKIVLQGRLQGAEMALKAIDADALRKAFNAEGVLLGNCRSRIKDRHERLQKLRSEYAHCLYLQEALGDKGIATAVIENAVPVLNKAADQVSTELGAHVEPVFAATREKDGKVFNEVTLSSKTRGEDVSYVSNSGGEKSLLDFTAGIAVQELVSSNHGLNLAVFDEALDHLDQESGEAVVRYLEKLAEKKAVWLISHQPWVKDAATFKKVITVTNDGKKSIITES